MTYIFSDLEGSSIENTLTSIKEDNNDTTNNEEIIIIGNIINSTNILPSTEEFFDTKTFNLQNISYCTFNDHRIKLLLGNKDLNFLKLYKFLEITQSETVDGVGSSYRILANFNIGNIEIIRDIYKKYFSKIVTWKKIKSEPSQFPLTDEEIRQYDASIKNINEPSNFITRFNNIFKNMMDAGSLLYSIPYEIERELNKVKKSIIDKEIIKKIFLERNIESKENSDHINYCAFIVLAIFRSLLAANPVLALSFDYSENKLNSNFCRGLLHNIYFGYNTSLILLYKNKYLLSCSGITKYFINFFSNDSFITHFYENVANLYNINDRRELDITNLSYMYLPSDTTNLTFDDLKKIIDRCNKTFKEWIKNYRDPIALLCISYMTTTNIKKTPIKGLYPHNKLEDNYFCPLGVGISPLLLEKELHYISTLFPIIQIFGNRQFGFANSFHKIDDYNMLICLYLSYLLNYIYIDDSDKVISKCKISLKKSKITLCEYNDIINDDITEMPTVYYNSTTGINEKSDDINIINTLDTLECNNTLCDEDPLIHYILNQHSILKHIFKSNEILIQLMYNGILKYNNIVYYVFSIIKNNLKDFYILSYDNIISYFKTFMDSVTRNNLLSIDDIDKINANIVALQEKINDINIEETNIMSNLTNNEYKMNSVEENKDTERLKTIISYKQQLLLLEKSTFQEKILNDQDILKKNNDYLFKYNKYTDEIAERYKLYNEYSKIITKYKKYKKYYDSFYVNSKNNIIRAISDFLKSEANDKIKDIVRTMKDDILFTKIRDLFRRISNILPETSKIMAKNPSSIFYLDFYKIRDKIIKMDRPDQLMDYINELSEILKNIRANISKENHDVYENLFKEYHETASELNKYSDKNINEDLYLLLRFYDASLFYYKESKINTEWKNLSPDEYSSGLNISSRYMNILNEKYPYTGENKFILSYQFMTFVDKSDKTLKSSSYKKYLKYKNKYLTLIKNKYLKFL